MAVKNYLDYAGLKRVLKRLLPGARKIWHGTQAEWDALSAEEKAKYDQAEIIDAIVENPLSDIIGVTMDTNVGSTLPPTTSAAVNLCHFTLPKKGTYLIALRVTIAMGQGFAIKYPTSMYIIEPDDNSTQAAYAIVNAPSDNYVYQLKATTVGATASTITGINIQGEAVLVH